MGKKSVVLFSGGLDSTTVLAMAQSRDDEVYTLTFDYGQRHSVEVERAGRLAKEMGVKIIIKWLILISDLGVPALPMILKWPSTAKPKKWLQAFPHLCACPQYDFLSYALAYAEVLEADFIYIGVNA